MFYDKLREMPEPGSLQEVVCIIIQGYRQDQDVLRLIALMETTDEARVKALANFKDALMPHVARARADESKAIDARMQKYIRSGQWSLRIGGEDDDR